MKNEKTKIKAGASAEVVKNNDLMSENDFKYFILGAIYSRLISTGFSLNNSEVRLLCGKYRDIKADNKKPENLISYFINTDKIK
jgi:NADH:ubiquinone oxidoreductase subunit 2 (subunit N)